MPCYTSATSQLRDEKIYEAKFLYNNVANVTNVIMFIMPCVTLLVRDSGVQEGPPIVLYNDGEGMGYGRKGWVDYLSNSSEPV